MAKDPRDKDIYTADKGQPPSPDEGPTESSKRDRRDANIYTADKGRPPSPDDMGSIESIRPKTERQSKAAKDIRASMGFKKGGCCSASKRADGAAIRGKTKGRIV